ncbi:hypothetical protein [Salinifilum ghardaiensis]
MATPSSEDPLPSRDQLQRWISELVEAVEQEQVDTAELVDVLGQLRRLGRDAGWLADVLLLLSREQGATLPALATAWSRTGQSTYVHAPATRLAKLSEGYGSTAGVLAAYQDLPADASGDETSCG